MNNDWQHWIDRLEQGTLSSEEICEFESLLENPTEDQRAFVQQLMLDTQLDLAFNPLVPSTHQETEPQALRFTTIHALITAAAACIAVLITYSTLKNSDSAITVTPSPPLADTRLATITDTNKLADAHGFRIGQSLPKGKVQLPEGASIGIAMAGGARLDINGPATFDINNGMNIFLDSGRVETYAPEYAHGFTIHTNQGKVVDLGTKFVTAINPELGTEIHVKEGLVEASPAKNKPLQKIKKGEAVILQKGILSSTQYLANRLHVPLNPNLLDSDQDGFADLIEKHYNTDSSNKKSFPLDLRIDASFQHEPKGLLPEKNNDNSPQKMEWFGSGNILKEGLNYSNNGHTLLTTPGSIQTSGISYAGATLPIPEDTFPTQGAIYFSFLMKIPEEHILRSEFAGLILYKDSSKEQLFVGGLSQTNSFGSRMLERAVQDKFNQAEDSHTHLFVVKMDQTRQITDVYLDPKIGIAEPQKVTKRYQDCPAFSSVMLRSGGKIHFPVQFDEIRFGLSWESVLPILKK